MYSPPHLSALQLPGGPILGGTLVTLVGSDVHPQPLPDGVALHCKFGRRLVAASNGTCIVPDDLDTLAGLLLSADESTDQLVLYGSARREGDAVRLNEPKPTDNNLGGDGQTGYAILAFEPPDHETPNDLYQALSISFNLLLDEDGYGASFSFGDLADESPSGAAVNDWGLPEAALGEAGGGMGLRVLFQTADKRRVVVLYAGEQLGSCNLPRRERSGPTGLGTKCSSSIDRDKIYRHRAYA